MAERATEPNDEPMTQSTESIQQPGTTRAGDLSTIFDLDETGKERDELQRSMAAVDEAERAADEESKGITVS